MERDGRVEETESPIGDWETGVPDRAREEGVSVMSKEGGQWEERVLTTAPQK